MKQKMIIRTFLGAALGLSLWAVFSILAAWLRGQWQFPSVSGHLVMAYGSELGAVTAQCIGAVLCGVLWCNASLIFREKDWSFPVQTGVHIVVCMVPAMAIAWFMHFIPHSLDGLIQYLRLFGAIYLLNWAVQYLHLRKALKQINNQLRMREEAEGQEEPLKQIIEEETGRKRKHELLRFPAIAAVLVLCICFPIAGMAAGNSGFFRDIMRGSTVVGLEYEQATGEIAVTAEYSEERVAVKAVLLAPEKAPFSVLEELSAGNCRIVDAEGKTVAEIVGSESAVVSGGQAILSFPVERLDAGVYVVRIDSFTGSAKAEQPLTMKGFWECGFTVE